MIKPVVFAVLCLSMIAAFTPAQSQPKLQVEEGMRLDFGRAVKGTVVEKKVTLRNIGSDTLTVSKIDVACGCTATVLSEKRIPPGGSGSFVIKFNTAGLSGTVHKNVIVNSDAANLRSARIDFSAMIVNEVTFAPDELIFKDAQPGTKYSSTLAIRNEGTDTLVINSFRTKVRGLTLQLPRGPILPGQSVDLVAEFLPEREVPTIADRIILATSSRTLPEITVPVYGSVKVFRFEEVGGLK